MQYAHVLVALNGERDNTVPKYFVTAAEIAVLRAVHGDEAVHDIHPCDPPKDENGDPVRVRNRDEMIRLKEAYPSPDARRKVEGLFPGMSARVPETLAELDLPDELYRPKERERPRQAVEKPPADEVNDREREGPTRIPARDEQGSASSAEFQQAKDAGLQDDGIHDIMD